MHLAIRQHRQTIECDDDAEAGASVRERLPALRESKADQVLFEPDGAVPGGMADVALEERSESGGVRLAERRAFADRRQTREGETVRLSPQKPGQRQHLFEV